jgi:hypothetical protein
LKDTTQNNTKKYSKEAPLKVVDTAQAEKNTLQKSASTTTMERQKISDQKVIEKKENMTVKLDTAVGFSKNITSKAESLKTEGSVAPKIENNTQVKMP